MACMLRRYARQRSDSYARGDADATSAAAARCARVPRVDAVTALMSRRDATLPRLL